MEKNTRAHSLYRGYSNQIPEYLQDRPKYVVDMAREKETLAQDIPVGHVKYISDGVFQVKSQEAKDEWYGVEFGNEDNPPHCECKFWCRNHLPCKHLFAIFRHYPEWGWDKLPLHYTQSPRLTLDEAVIGQNGKAVTSPVESVANDELPLNSTATNSSQHDQSPTLTVPAYGVLPSRKRSPKAVRGSCREILHEIRQIDDAEELECLKIELQEIQERLKKAVPSDEGLQLEPQSKKKKLQPTSKMLAQKEKLPKIAKPPLRKHKYSGRHGSWATTMRNT